MSDAAGPADQHRTGTRVLRLLSSPLHGNILRAHLEGPLRLSELQQKAAWPAQTTLRAATRSLRQIGALRSLQVKRMPRSVATELTAIGESVLGTTEALERWLARAPHGPIPFDSTAAEGVMQALTAGWSSPLIKELATQPVTLAELDRRIPELSYPALERRLTRLRITRQVEPLPKAPDSDRGTPYAVTEWLRYATAPISLASRCEYRDFGERLALPSAVEVETLLLLALPLLELPRELNGSAMLAMPTHGAGEPTNGGPVFTGLPVEVERGRVIHIGVAVEEEPHIWAMGPPDAWISTIIDADTSQISFGGGTPALAEELAKGLNRTLF